MKRHKGLQTRNKQSEKMASAAIVGSSPLHLEWQILQPTITTGRD